MNSRITAQSERIVRLLTMNRDEQRRRLEVEAERDTWQQIAEARSQEEHRLRAESQAEIVALKAERDRLRDRRNHIVGEVLRLREGLHTWDDATLRLKVLEVTRAALEAENKALFHNHCNCGGYAWTMNGRDERQPHMTWCPQAKEYAEWYLAEKRGK